MYNQIVQHVLPSGFDHLSPVPKQHQQQQQQQQQQQEQEQEQEQEEQHSWHPLEGADLRYVDCTKHFESSLVLDHR